MGRLIQNEIKRPLADEILFGRLTNGGHVNVDVDPETEKLVMEFTETSSGDADSPNIETAPA